MQRLPSHRLVFLHEALIFTGVTTVEDRTPNAFYLGSIKEDIDMNDTTALLPHIKLKFNIEHPSYEECYLFGYECAHSEVAEEDNPFRAGSQEAEQWLEGWWAGFYGEEPLFDMSIFADEEPEVKHEAANDQQYQKTSILTLVFEISGALAASAIVGYQLLELVA